MHACLWRDKKRRHRDHLCVRQRLYIYTWLVGLGFKLRLALHKSLLVATVGVRSLGVASVVIIRITK
ncbi:hypothetical protein GGR50DRAFT_650742 [Xylaria sp. CBS 124048]|nr:hypothetical protein GGR50DRAFT_650742 [Xylaria sp. CBS 124048]